MKLKKIYAIMAFQLFAGSLFAQAQLDSLAVTKLSPLFSQPTLKNNKLVVPKIKGYEVSLIGSDNKVVIDLNGQISQPLIDKKVNVLYKIVRKSDHAFGEIPMKDIVIKGVYGDQGVGEQPFVIPSLREWYGVDGVFKLRSESAIVLQQQDEESAKAAQLLKEDIKKLIGLDLPVRTGEPKAGDIFIGSKGDKALGNEGYSLKIDDVFSIQAPNYNGKVFGTRTLLQLLSQNNKQLTIPKGFSRDYPTYEVRGFMLDVGRKFFTIDFLNDYVELMSYYKMSNFHIHLSDNAFPKYFNYNWDNTYSGFRLENERYPNLASKDGHYTKAEFIALQKKALRYGVTIIPEIDVPAHSLAISQAVPGVGSEKYGQDHLDLDNPLTYEVVKNIFDEYTKGPNPVFIGEEVHVGTDEYDKSESEKFRKFTDFVIKVVQGNGKKVRAWGALTHAQGTTPVTVKDVRLNMWYNGYADPIAMKKLGYQQISTPDGWLYIVPAAGYYYDYLNTDNLYNNWEPRKIGDITFEKGDPIVDGGMFAVWNDIAGNGISEKDVHNRVFPAVQVLSEKMWGAEDLHSSLFTFNEKKKSVIEAPGLNMRGHYIADDPLLLYLNFDSQTRNQLDNEWKDAQASGTQFEKGIKGNGLKFTGDASQLVLPIAEIGEQYTVSFWVKPAAQLKGDLFKSKNAKIFSDDKGLGFTRDGYQYYFDYSLPVNEWSQVSITGDNIGTQLYVNGKLVKDMKPYDVVMPYKDKNNGKEIKYKKVQTLVFPLSEISLKNAILDELKVYNQKMTAQELMSEFRMR
ncbi:family 20 glycosylhydrolase [Sphingobacterium sp. ML3W]|uniref:family 20 glycosylhydrolase n=1 Tax=Sphingobacterium sp. ML3W TaxID=1538644 RepID=UPI0006921991|nr:family 20 glycosylhydrolase [Sphingobacterium sp. ML3W]